MTYVCVGWLIRWQGHFNAVFILFSFVLLGRRTEENNMQKDFTDMFDIPD